MSCYTVTDYLHFDYPHHYLNHFLVRLTYLPAFYHYLPSSCLYLVLCLVPCFHFHPLGRYLLVHCLVHCFHFHPLGHYLREHYHCCLFHIPSSMTMIK